MLALGVDVDVNVDGEVEKIQRKDGGFGAKDGMELYFNRKESRQCGVIASLFSYSLLLFIEDIHNFTFCVVT